MSSVDKFLVYLMCLGFFIIGIFIGAKVKAEDVYSRGECHLTHVDDTLFCETPKEICFIRLNQIVDVDGRRKTLIDCMDNTKNDSSSDK